MPIASVLAVSLSMALSLGMPTHASPASLVSRGPSPTALVAKKKKKKKEAPQSTENGTIIRRNHVCFGTMKAAISGDGRYAVFFARYDHGFFGEKMGMFLRDDKTGNVEYLGTGFEQPAISEDGNLIAYQDAQDGDITLNPSGSYVGKGNAQTWLVFIDRRTGKRVTARNGSIVTNTHPDGQSFVQFTPGGTRYYYDSSSGKVSKIDGLPDGGDMQFVYTADGQEAAVDDYHGDGEGPVITELIDTARTIIGHGMLLNASDDGRRILFTSEDEHVTLYDVSNGKHTTLACGNGSVSGNGKYIICTPHQQFDQTNHVYDAYRYDIDKKEWERLSETTDHTGGTCDLPISVPSKIGNCGKQAIAFGAAFTSVDKQNACTTDADCGALVDKGGKFSVVSHVRAGGSAMMTCGYPVVTSGGQGDLPQTGNALESCLSPSVPATRLSCTTGYAAQCDTKSHECVLRADGGR